MEIDLIKREGAFIPSLDEDFEKAKTIRYGQIVRVKLTKPRNSLFHRKFMALMQFLFQNQERYKTLKDLIVEIKLKTGHYQEHVTLKGKIVYVPKSISFAKMDEHEFRIFYSKTIDVCISSFLEGMTVDEINQRVEQILLGWG